MPWSSFQYSAPLRVPLVSADATEGGALFMFVTVTARPAVHTAALFHFTPRARGSNLLYRDSCSRTR